MSKKIIRKINISGDEEIIDIIKKSLWHYFWPLFIAIILMLLPFFLIYPLFLQGTWGVFLFFGIVNLALLLIYRIYLAYSETALVITNKKLIDMERLGFLNSSSSIILYGKIQDVNYKSKGLLKTILKIGHVYIFFTDDKNSFIELKSMKYPALVISKIINQRENYFDAKGETAGKEAIKILRQIKKRLGEDKFNRLISN